MVDETAAFIFENSGQECRICESQDACSLLLPAWLDCCLLVATALRAVTGRRTSHAKPVTEGDVLSVVDEGVEKRR